VAIVDGAGVMRPSRFTSEQFAADEPAASKKEALFGVFSDFAEGKRSREFSADKWASGLYVKLELRGEGYTIEEKLTSLARETVALADQLRPILDPESAEEDEFEEEVITTTYIVRTLVFVGDDGPVSIF
jgi:hypothetical protein